jgi:C-terminal processing protease CtpA/Prc
MRSRAHILHGAAVGILIAVIVAGCSDLVVNPADHPGNSADFERAWAITDSVYPYFQFKRINWDSIHTIYAPLAARSQGDEFFTVLYNLLGELKDGHVDLRSQSGQEVRPFTPPRTARDQFTFDPLLVRKYFTTDLALAGSDNMEYGILPDGIGYLRIASFSTGPWIHEFDNVLASMRATKGLIIDVRNNGGGSTNMSDVIVSRFLTSPLAYFPVYKGGKLQPVYSLAPSGPFMYSHPVVVLINGVSFSTTECFAEMMKQIPSVTVVGDTTGGGGGAPEYYPLPSGRKIRISTKNLCRYDGAPQEWNGIPPDVVVMQTRDDVRRGRDLQLERAIRLLEEL